MSRRGVLGGTFDPIHLGHLVAAQEALEHLSLDRVVFVPAGEPPHKQGRPLSAVGHRLRMLELGLEGNERFQISPIDLERPGPHYSADTVEILAREWGPEMEIWFIMGMDSLRDLGSWHEPQRLIRTARLAVAERPGVQLDLHRLQHEIPGLMERLHFLPIPEVEISSSDLQARVAEGRSIRYMVPDKVEAYIREQGLYREG